MHPFTDETLNEIIRRIVHVANPVRIMLFGSHARGDAGPDSDVDLMVIVKGPVNRRETARKIYRSLIGVGYPADIIVNTTDDIERYGNAVGLIIPHVLAEGKEVYAA